MTKVPVTTSPIVPLSALLSAALAVFNQAKLYFSSLRISLPLSNLTALFTTDNTSPLSIAVPAAVKPLVKMSLDAAFKEPPFTTKELLAKF